MAREWFFPAPLCTLPRRREEQERSSLLSLVLKPREMPENHGRHSMKKEKIEEQGNGPTSEVQKLAFCSHKSMANQSPTNHPKSIATVTTATLVPPAIDSSDTFFYCSPHPAVLRGLLLLPSIPKFTAFSHSRSRSGRRTGTVRRRRKRMNTERAFLYRRCDKLRLLCRGTRATASNL
ncbi:hypothetical protein GW17_00010180 [Ensete ventricosum]|nr:hypothetical protein GW17_00010180 [Ensete ventricosum]